MTMEVAAREAFLSVLAEMRRWNEPPPGWDVRLELKKSEKLVHGIGEGGWVVA